MGNQTQNIIPEFFKHLSERNLTELIKLFSETIDWDVPGDKSKAPWLGKRRGKAEVREFYDLLWRNTEPLSVTVDDTLIDNDVVIISGDFSTKMLQTNRIVDSLFFIKITIKDGLIIKYRLLEDTLEVA
ncbi:nuclear transport factor 2 family protein, partial [Sphingobacterium shayense]|uniref:nuclear transport factor 2 family protein n=1 Tax=Sphingobacterium shayense TaxID=626343 RepID=UPI0015560C8E